MGSIPRAAQKFRGQKELYVVKRGGRENKVLSLNK